MNVNGFVFQVCFFQMLCNTITILVVKHMQKAFCLCRLVIVVFFVDSYRVFACVDFSCNAFRFVGVNVTEIVALVFRQSFHL